MPPTTPTFSALQACQTFDTRSDFAFAGDRRASTYLHGPQQPKACFHPLRTAAGHNLTGFETSDHLWHRGLWFTIKYLNKINFWEEGPNEDEFGRHYDRSQPCLTLLDHETVAIDHEIEWRSKVTGVALREQRFCKIKSVEGVRCLDWSTRLTFAQDLLLDRTPFTTWGGYGGMSYRSTRQLHDVHFLLPGGETTERITGEAHDWVLCQGMVDNGPHQAVSLGMIDHPSNPRSRVPWYCRTGGNITFMNAAFLFHEPMPVKEGESLTFNYRILYRDGVWQEREFALLADAFRESKPEGVTA